MCDLHLGCLAASGYSMMRCTSKVVRSPSWTLIIERPGRKWGRIQGSSIDLKGLSWATRHTSVVPEVPSPAVMVCGLGQVSLARINTTVVLSTATRQIF